MGHIQKFEVERIKAEDIGFTHSAATGTNSYSLFYFASLFGTALFVEQPVLTDMAVAGTGWFEIDTRGADYIAIAGHLGFANTEAEITFPQSRLGGAALGLPHADGAAFTGVPQPTSADSSEDAWRGMNLDMVANDWIGQPVSRVPAATATLADNAILNVIPSGTMSPTLETYFQFWVGHRLNNLSGANMSAAQVMRVGLPRVSGLDKVWVQIRVGLEITNANAGALDCDFIGSLVAVKYRDVMSIDGKQASLLGGRSAPEAIG